MSSPQIIVIGAGPAGLLAAGQAALAGARVVLLEKMEQPARKLRITGKGRCNLTNTKPWSDFETHIFPLARHFRPAFMNFPNTALVDFMAQAGVPVVTERGDRVFPASSRAQDVAEALVRWAQRQGVAIHCHTEVRQLLVEAHRVTAVETTSGGCRQTLAARAVIVATGGLSYPLTGSTGDGLRWAEATGHTLTPVRPSLVALHVAGLPASLSGLALRNVLLQLWVDGNPADEEFGEMTFTDNGVEGPVALRLSRRAVDALRQGKPVQLVLNCKPALSRQQLLARLQREQAAFAGMPLAALLRKWLPAQLVPAFIGQAGMASGKKAGQLSSHDLAKLAALFHAWKMEVTGYGGYERAVVTAGGVAMKDIDPKTLRSRRVENLFFAGEVLDLDADTGGYNLQIAFSTGFLAGRSAAGLS
jgi:predicted Rossmann fold flavoprotein